MSKEQEKQESIEAIKELLILIESNNENLIISHNYLYRVLSRLLKSVK